MSDLYNSLRVKRLSVRSSSVNVVLISNSTLMPTDCWFRGGQLAVIGELSGDKITAWKRNNMDKGTETRQGLSFQGMMTLQSQQMGLQIGRHDTERWCPNQAV